MFNSGTVPMFVLNTTIAMISMLVAYHVVRDLFIFLLFSTRDIKAKLLIKIFVNKRLHIVLIWALLPSQRYM